MLKEALKRLMLGGSLDERQMAEAVGAIMDGEATGPQIAAFLVALRVKGETIEEITGAARAMRERMTRIDVERRPLIDTCGTGGDGAGTFNISTAVGFVVAAGGIAVAKHGNRAISSRSGSADVLTALGVDIGADAATVTRCIEEIGIGFLFAPACHPAMKNATPIRRELGVRTIFNVLGPLTNPAGAKVQLLGVFDRDLVRPMAESLARLGSSRAWVVHGADGLDELTVCDVSYVAELSGGEVREMTIAPEDVGLQRSYGEGLHGGTPAENAKIMRELLGGERQGPLHDVVALNAGAAFYVAGATADLEAGVGRAQEIMAGGEPLRILDRLVETAGASD
jgi:anthranilate phosphoribosyltransferase